MGNAVKVVRYNGYAVVVKYDECPESPREWGNLGKLFLKTRSVYKTECKEDGLEKARVKIPVYKYEHSGVCLQASTGGNPFSCPWDSCLAGYVVAFADDIRKNYGVKRVTKKIVEKVTELLIGEVKTYSQYIEGEVYGFVAYKVDNGVADGDVEDEGEQLDSCWGFYSVEDALNEGKDTLPEEAFATPVTA